MLIFTTLLEVYKKISKFKQLFEVVGSHSCAWDGASRALQTCCIKDTAYSRKTLQVSLITLYCVKSLSVILMWDGNRFRRLRVRQSSWSTRPWLWNCFKFKKRKKRKNPKVQT